MAPAGFDPKSILVMKRHGSDVISLKGILSEVSKVTVHEGKQGIRFAPYLPFDREGHPPPVDLGKRRRKRRRLPAQRPIRKTLQRASRAALRTLWLA
jgi:hypothetical protein